MNEVKHLGKTRSWSQITRIDDYMLDNFLRTCAGYCAATYCMGIGDRHPSNVMVTETGIMFS